MNGHLELVMPTAAYVMRASAVSNEPQHPGVQPVHAANATAALITSTNRAYDHAMAKFKTCSTVKETLKQQVLSAVDPIYYQDLEDDTFGYADVLIPAIIQHLTTTYGTLTASDLEINRDHLTEAWNPDEPIENLSTGPPILTADSTCTETYVSLSCPVLNKRLTTDPIKIKIPNGARKERKRIS